MPLITSENLDLAVSAHAALTLTPADGCSSAPAKFLSASADPPGIWVQITATPAAAASAATDQLATDNTPVTASFVHDGARFLFDTTVARRDKHHWLTDTLYVDALLLVFPDEVTSPEHRRARRHRISDSVGGIHATLYRAGDNGEPAEVPGVLWDLSAGGASFVCPTAKAANELPAKKPLVVALNFRGRRILLLAYRTHARQLSGRSARLGLRFDFSRPTSAPSQTALLRACAELDQQAQPRKT